MDPGAGHGPAHAGEPVELGTSIAPGGSAPGVIATVVGASAATIHRYSLGLVTSVAMSMSSTVPAGTLEIVNDGATSIPAQPYWVGMLPLGNQSPAESVKPEGRITALSESAIT